MLFRSDNAIEWLTRAAEGGNEFAQYALGRLLLEKGDKENGVRWLTASAGQGDQFAQYTLGKHLLQGEVIPKDIQKSLHWLTASAEQGNQFAQYTLGKLFLLGREVEQDRETAVRWLTLSAEQGNIYAQYYLLHLDDFRDQLVRQGVARLFHHLGNLFLEQLPPAGQGVKMGTNHKLRRKLREKKAAQGHKRDDREPVMTS